MALRIQLINDLVGSLVIDKADPIDINSLTKTIKRSDENEGVFYEIVFDLDFIKKGRRFIKSCYETAGGIDAVVLCNLYSRNMNLRKWELYGTGQLNLNKYELGEITVTVNIEQTGVERRVLNLMDTKIDIETLLSENGSALAPVGTRTSPYHSKAILKKYNAAPTNNEEFQALDVFNFHLNNTGANGINRDGLGVMSLEFQKETNKELEEIFTPVFGATAMTNDLANGSSAGTLGQYQACLSGEKDGRFEFYKATEAGIMDLDIQVRAKPSISARNDGGDIDYSGDDNALGNWEVNLWLEKRDVDNNIVYIERIGTQWTTPYSATDFRAGNYELKNIIRNSEAVAVGDKYYLYMTYRVFGGSYEEPGSLSSEGDVWHTLIVQLDETQSHIKLTNKTTFEETSVKNLMIFEAAKRCVQYYTNEVDCFTSSLLGRTDLGYASDGKASLIALTVGEWLRGRTDKKMFISLKEIIDFLNSVYCVGFGFIYVNGKQHFILEERSYFYNKSLKILSLTKVYDVKKSVMSKYYANEVEYGYTGKLDIAQINAIDEPNTVRRSTIPIRNTKGKLKIGAADVKTSGYQIESQRRFANSTKDSKLDAAIFATVMLRDGGGFKTKKNEGYISIQNVFDEGSGYNYDISPARCLQNWRQYIAAMLIRSFNKKLKFGSGEGNYEMITHKSGDPSPLAENGEVDLTYIEPLIDPEIYKFDHPLSNEEWKLIETNPFGYIEFEDKFGEKMEGFISPEGIEHDVTNKKADFVLIKVHRPS